MKLEFFKDDPRLRNLSAVPNYLNPLFSRGEITGEQKKEMRPKFFQTGRTQYLSKMRKSFDTLPCGHNQHIT